jgi:subfamily B ATP-binding cassette protein MsbA
MARIGDVNEVQTPFLHFRTSYKEPLLLFCTRDHVYYQHKTDFIRFDFHANFGMDHFEISQELRAKSLEAQKESGQLISIVDETLGGLKVIKSYNAEPNFKVDFMIQ